jgi:hypothetical protein
MAAGRAGGAVSDGSDLSAAPLVGAFDDPLGCNDDLGDDALGNLAPPPTVAIQRADINIKVSHCVVQGTFYAL